MPLDKGHVGIPYFCSPYTIRITPIHLQLINLISRPTE